MPRLIPALVLTFGLLFDSPVSLTSEAQAQDLPPAPDLFTMITTNDPQTQMMALILTRTSVQEGRSARILLCSHAGDLALETPPESALQPFGPRQMTPHGLLTDLVEAGVQTEVCAIYPNSRDIGLDELIDGVTQARPGPVAAAMAGPNTQLFTF